MHHGNSALCIDIDTNISIDWKSRREEEEKVTNIVDCPLCLIFSFIQLLFKHSNGDMNRQQSLNS